MGSKLLSFILLATLFHQYSTVVAFRFVNDDDHHAENIQEMPEAIQSRDEMEAYLKTKGLFTDPKISGARSTTNTVFLPPISPACSVYPSVQEVRNNYQATVAAIVAASTLGTFKGQTYNDLAYYVDTYDRRLAGSPLLEESLDFILYQMNNIGATNLQQENVNVPAWVRGYESLSLLTNHGERKLAFFGLGQSVSTPKEGITAEVVVVNSLAELTAKAGTFANKIVVVNYVGSALSPLDSTGNGYSIVAANGALAALYRSAATFSLDSPHTRRSNLYYTANSTKIPIGYLSFEAGDLMTRLSQRGTQIVLRLIMQNTDGYGVSRNLFGDLQGRSNPDQFVLLAAHTDSWDIAQAAQDDGVGVILALKAFELIKNLLPVPRRTLRLALWTGEEWTFLGSAKYLSTRGKVDGLSTIIEADYSCLASNGLVWFGHPELGCVLNEIVNLVGSASAGLVVSSPSVSSDVDLFAALGVPVATLLGDNGQYFWYHHSAADTMTAVNTTELDRCLALWTSTAYILSDLQNPITRLF